MSRAATKLPAETYCKNQCDINKSNPKDILNETITSNLKPTLEYDLIEKKIQLTPNDQILLHLNLNSLQVHIDEPIELIQAIIIFMSEARLRDEQIIDINIPGYSFMHNPSPTQAGGVGIYVKSNLSTKQLPLII